MFFSPKPGYFANHLHHQVLRNSWTQSFTERQQPPAFPIPENQVNGLRLFPGRHMQVWQNPNYSRRLAFSRP
jgi:hypothetical protein